jgi:hypothetical protein
VRVPGYSWKTNEYGLTVDTVTEFHLVSPNGTQMVVTETDKDLWFALKVCLYMGDGKGNELTVGSHYREDLTTTYIPRAYRNGHEILTTIIYRQGNRD